MLACLLITPLAAQQPPTQQQPKTMIRLQVQLDSPEASKNSFAAKPKIIYRAGTQFCRLEEEPDPERGIHGLMITNEPDAWMINLATNSAQHMVDPGPTFNCRMPIFAGQLSSLPEDEAKQVQVLEFGHELEFFKANGAVAHPGMVLQTKQTILYKLTFGDSAVALFTYGTPERPVAAAWTRGDKHEIFWYSSYEPIDFDGRVFARPEHVKIEEVGH
jgi:hypothetical protein